jgi:hypothetical protein
MSRRMTRRRRLARREAAEERAARRVRERGPARGCTENANPKAASPRQRRTRCSYSPRSTKWNVGELCEETVVEYLAGPWRKFKGHFPRTLRPLARISMDHLGKVQRARIRELMPAVARRAPKIIDDRYMNGFLLIAELRWIRPLDEWKPRGCSRDAIFKSLVAHLLVTYPLPGFLYSIFMGNSRWIFSHDYAVRFFLAVARGESPYRHFRAADFPVRMTRHMCHLFMHMPSDCGFIEGIRHVQIVANGGDAGIARAVCGSVLGRELQVCREPFWDTVFRWLCRQGDLERGQIGPLIDHFAAMRETDPYYSVKGRTYRSALRAMEKWHKELAIRRELEKVVFTPSGFKGKKYLFRKKLNGEVSYNQEWTMREILHSSDLIDEGERMHHCVSCYATDIREKKSSIWSLRCEGVRGLTVEVANEARMVVQARGKCNRDPKPLELAILRRWALDNKLKVSSWL